MYFWDIVATESVKSQFVHRLVTGCVECQRQSAIILVLVQHNSIDKDLFSSFYRLFTRSRETESYGPSIITMSYCYYHCTSAGVSEL